MSIDTQNSKIRTTKQAKRLVDQFDVDVDVIYTNIETHRHVKHKPSSILGPISSRLNFLIGLIVLHLTCLISHSI